jgi:hypothetical protein
LAYYTLLKCCLDTALDFVDDGRPKGIVSKFCLRAPAKMNGWKLKCYATWLCQPKKSKLGCISKNHSCSTRKICILRPSFVHKFTLTFHHAFALCAPLMHFLTDLGRLYALRVHPTFMKSAPNPSFTFLT